MKRFSLITLLLFVFLSISNAIELTESNIVESIENTELSKDGLLAKDILNFTLLSKINRTILKTRFP